MRRILPIILLCLGVPAQAANVALVVANQQYDTRTPARGAEAVSAASAALEDMGFHVFAGEGLNAEEMRAQLAGMHERIMREGAERVVVVLAGHFAQSRSGGWLVGRDADAPGLALADGQGLRLDIVLEIAALATDGAVVWLGESTSTTGFGSGLDAGLPPRLMAPQGVGVVRGRADQVLAGLRQSLRPGTTLASVVDRNRNLTGEGAIPSLVPFLPEGYAPSARADLRAFATAQEADTEDAYQAYLDSFPNGQNAQAARAALERIRNSPERIEQALMLTRDERRAIQNDLTVLGYDTRGVDGIFGPGTRGAITTWQRQNDLSETGYLTQDQIFNLARQGADRAQELEAEERARREAEERSDRDFWAATGAAGDEAGLRRYLERYPEGIFAGLAQDRLAQFEAEARDAARARDLAAWRRARNANTIAGYEAYLQDWPEGEFAENARSRARALQPESEDSTLPPGLDQSALARARAAEQQLGLAGPTRLLIEQRLARLGLDTGPVDGVFDDQTRIAIGQAQERFDLRPTGYVNQDLLTMLVSNLFREFFD
ncbi:MAG: peptidoglycan-binding protein [Roseinatronobacter sp.]